MKNLKKLSFLTAIAVLLLFSCSKSDTTSEPINITGGAVFRSQVVTVTLPDTNLPENEYQATLDGAAITMTKSEDNKLVFLVPFTTTIGLHDLVIPTINNATIHYDIKDMELTDTPEVTMASFSTNLGTFSQTLDTSVESVNIQNSIASFNAVFDHASTADKTKIAILYKANKAIFDDLILNDFSNINGKITFNDVKLLHKHTNAVMVMAIGAVMTIGLPTPIEKCLGIVLVGVGAKKAIQFFHQLELAQLETITMNVNDVDGVNNRGTNGVQNTIISLQDNAASALSFNTKDRGLITTDASSTQTGIAAFFKIYNKYNYFGDKVNTIITFVNANVPFANFSLLKSDCPFVIIIQ
jgi:hypothetical protein